MADTLTVETTTPSTTSTSTSVPSTAESTPSTPSIPTPKERPSFRVALKEAAAKTAAASASPPPAAIVPDASVDPTTSTASPGSKPVGEPPPEKWPTILDNARTKAAAEERAKVETEYRQKYGNHDPETVTESVQWRTWAKQDPGAFLERAVLDGLSNPASAPAIKSTLGKMLNAMRGSPRTAATPVTGPPPPDFRDDHGNEFYSAKTQAQRDEWLKGQILQEIDPLRQEVQQTKADREAEQARVQRERAQTQVKQQITSHIEKAKASWPHFAAHQKEILALVATMPLTSGHPAEEAMVLRDAYDQVVLPKLSELEQNRVLADLKQKATASSLNPANTGAPTGIPKSVRAKDGGTMGNALKWAAERTAGR